MEEILSVRRFAGDPETTIGMFFLSQNDPTFICFSLEDEHHAVKQHGDTRIPEGTYELTLVTTPKWSKRMGHPMIMLLGVPNFSSILIHPMNSEDDTEGCLGTGETIGYDRMKKRLIIPPGQSTPAYHRLYNLIAPIIKEYQKNGKKPAIRITSEVWKPFDETGDQYDPAVAGLPIV